MTTYEHLVDATLPHGLMPLVVPQLKTITLGGAVTGLGIESSSFRNGCPHESVLELEVLTGDGRSSSPAPTTSTATCSAASRTPTARWATPCGCDRAGAGAALRAAPPPAVPTTPLTTSRPSRRSAATGALARRAGRLPRRHRVRPRRALPHARDVRRRGAVPVRLHGQQIYYRSIQRRARTTSRSATTCGAGTPTGSGARARSACSTRSCAASCRSAGCAATSTGSSSASSAGTAGRAPATAARPPGP